MRRVSLRLLERQRRGYVCSTKRDLFSWDFQYCGRHETTGRQPGFLRSTIWEWQSSQASRKRFVSIVFWQSVVVNSLCRRLPRIIP